MNNLLNDITEPNIQIPSVTESNTYFAPISPANTTTTNNTTSNTTSVKLLEMLQRGNKSSQNGQGDATNTVIPMMKSSSIKDMGENLNVNLFNFYYYYHYFEILLLLLIKIKHCMYSFSIYICNTENFLQKLVEKLCIVLKN